MILGCRSQKVGDLGQSVIGSRARLSRHRAQIRCQGMSRSWLWLAITAECGQLGTDGAKRKQFAEVVTQEALNAARPGAGLADMQVNSLCHWSDGVHVLCCDHQRERQKIARPS